MENIRKSLSDGFAAIVFLSDVHICATLRKTAAELQRAGVTLAEPLPSK